MLAVDTKVYITTELRVLVGLGMSGAFQGSICSLIASVVMLGCVQQHVFLLLSSMMATNFFSNE